MAETKAVNSTLDPDHLTAEQVEQLLFVLGQLSLHQLIQLAAMIKQVCEQPGFGRVSITIEKGHPIEIEAGQREKFLLNQDEQRLHDFME